MFFLALGLSALAGYLLGSVNFAVLVSTRLYSKDVRTMGSGNAGMTNVLRNFGKKGAALTMAGDTGKGILAVFCGRLLMMLLVPGTEGLFGGTLYGAYIAGLFTVIGHTFPIFFGFKGGKGIATTLGVILALEPLVALILLAIFLVIVKIGKMVSLGSVLGIMFYPVLTWVWCTFLTHDPVVFCTVCSFIITALIVWMHRSNVKRILSGTEYKFGQPKPQQTAAGSENEGEK